MTIFPLSEGAFSIDKSKIFIPFDKGVDDIQQRSLGSLLVEVQPFVICSKNDIILLDAGLGFCNADGTLQIHQNLIDLGINPMEVTKVFLSHLHKDHSGGAIMEDSLLKKQFLSFPNAIYYVNKQEFDFAVQSGYPSYTTEDFLMLKDSGNVVFIEGSGTIDGYIRFETIGAHCPHHMALWMEEAGQIIFYGADVAPQLQQMKTRFVAKYDFDGKKAMELRSKWWSQAQEEHWTILFYHDIKTPFVKL
jgi:glyoxylase-like metal-dependent hydrolase (beta-lactamase superfamily II)